MPRGARDELAGRAGHGAIAGSVVEAFDRAVELFDRRRFFEAHECFEYIWKTGPEDERPFWKGLTQFAAGLCHCQRGNAHGALALIARSAGYLERYRSPYRGVDLTALAEAGRRIVEEIESHGASSELPFPPFPLA